MKKDNIYFAENGLTSTSCNHVANMAKEYAMQAEEELNATSFINKYIGIIGTDLTPASKGMTDLEYIDKDLSLIAEMHSLIAWLREALKAKDNLKKEIQGKTLMHWCNDNDKEYPESPEMEDYITEDDVLSTWSVKDRNRYLSLGAKVSVYGKFLHNEGTFAKARKKQKLHANCPFTYNENGRDTIVEKYELSLPLATVDNKFFELQSAWRKMQAEYNGYAHKVTLAIEEDKERKNSKYLQQQEEYNAKIQVLAAEFRKWQDSELQRVANLKVVIPNDLKSAYDHITSLA